MPRREPILTYRDSQTTSRRSFIQWGAAAVACQFTRHAFAGGAWRLPLADELNANALVKRCGLKGLAQVTDLGVSAAARPIRMISLGHGDRAALIVGVPHANEPIGTLTAIRLLRSLGVDRQLRERLGFRWHFIPAIDIDGLALNEGWFRGPLTLERYFEDFYRPPFEAQPEYSFPLAVPGYRFDRPTPENLCWQRALELTRPTLQCSLHGADYGGAFFILSKARRDLPARLAALPAHFGIPLDELGEPSADMEAIRPGVFAFSSIENSVRTALAAGKDPHESWGAGNSSAGFAARTYGTFSMTCEVPLWNDARGQDGRYSPFTMTNLLDEEIAQLEEDARLLADMLPKLADATTFECRALLATLTEARRASDSQLDELRQMRGAPGAGRRLRYREVVQYQAGTAGMRTLALMVRLARLQRTEASDASAVLARRIAVYRKQSSMRPVSLSITSALQAQAVMLAAESLI